MQTNYRESSPVNSIGSTSSSTAASHERVMRAGQSIFKDEKDDKSGRKKEDEESPEIGPKQ